MVQDGKYGHTIDLSDHMDAPVEMLQLVGAFNRMSDTVHRHVETIQATSRTDQLTGMCNRRHLLAEGYRIINVSIRAQKPCCCLMIDIDHFKLVNDNHGHPVGDRYLMHTAVRNNTVSIGVAEYSMEPDFRANILEDMIEKADKALYRAKLFGRNRVKTWPFPQDPSHAP